MTEKELITENRKSLSRLMRNVLSGLNPIIALNRFPCMIMQFDGRTKLLVWANKSLLEYLGYELEEMVDRPYTDFVAPIDKEETKKAHNDYLKGNEAGKIFLNHWLHKDGRKLPMYWIMDDIENTEIDNHNFGLAMQNNILYNG